MINNRKVKIETSTLDTLQVSAETIFAANLMTDAILNITPTNNNTKT